MLQTDSYNVFIISYLGFVVQKAKIKGVYVRIRSGGNSVPVFILVDCIWVLFRNNNINIKGKPGKVKC